MHVYCYAFSKFLEIARENFQQLNYLFVYTENLSTVQCTDN